MSFLTFAVYTIQGGFESLFPRQLFAPNRAFVVRSIHVDYFCIKWVHIIIHINVRTWIQGYPSSKKQSNVEISQDVLQSCNLVRFSWDCSRASQRTVLTNQWQFPKYTRDHARAETKKISISAHLWMYFSSVDCDYVVISLLDWLA